MNPVRYLNINNSTYNLIDRNEAYISIRKVLDNVIDSNNKIIKPMKLEYKNITVDYIYDLYNTLFESNALSSKVNFIQHQLNETPDIREYILTTRKYNEPTIIDGIHNPDAGHRGTPDTHIQKTKILITAGIHGNEKVNVIALYRFIEDFILNSSAIPAQFRENVELHIIPIVNPTGFDANSRYNDKQINLNRNFDWQWRPSDEGGTEANSAVETQVISKWLNDNNDALFYLDLHDSAEVNEITNFIGIQSKQIDRVKLLALQAIDSVIPYWQSAKQCKPPQKMAGAGEQDIKDYYEERNTLYAYTSTIPVNSDGVYSDYTGFAIGYATDICKIPSLVLEVSKHAYFANVDYEGNAYPDNYVYKPKFDNPGMSQYKTHPQFFSPKTLGCATDAIGNVLINMNKNRFILELPIVEEMQF